MKQRLKTIILFLFHFLLVSTPFVFTWINEELFEFNKMLFTYILTVLIAASWLARMFLEKKIILKKTKLDIPILIFLVSQILSTIFSIHRRTSILGYYTRFHGGLLSTISYITLFYAFVSNIDKKQIKGFLSTLVLAAFFVSLYAIPEHFGYSYSCLVIAKEFNVDCWVQDVQTRVFASFGQPNWLAAFLITLMPISISQYLNKKNPLNKAFYLTSSVLIFTSLLFTKSRSGLLGLAIALFIYFAGIIYLELNTNFIKDKANSFIASVLPIGFSFLMVGLIFGTPYTPSLSSIVSKKDSPQIESPQAAETTPSSRGGSESGDIRKIVWKGSIDVWKRYPIFGSGVETFAYSYYQDRPIEHNMVSEWDFLYNKAHNEFLNFLANTGAVGLASYVFLLINIFYFGSKSFFKSALKDQLSILALLSGLAALTISNFFGFSTVMVSILLFLMPAMMIVQTEGNKTDLKIKLIKDPSIKKLLAKFSPYLLLPLVGITIYLLSSIYNVWSADIDYSKGKTFIQMKKYTSGIEKLQSAIIKSPQEAAFYDELANAYAKAAVQLAENDEGTAGAELAIVAIKTSDYTLQLNPRHLNFHKTRSRIFMTLAQIDPSYLEQAKKTLLVALSLSPTDAKLMYNLGLVNLALENTTEGLEQVQTAILIKPNYLEARYDFAQTLEELGDLEKAKEEYQYILNNLVPGNEQVEARLKAVEASISAETK